MDFILELDTDTFLDLLNKANDDFYEEKIWEKYLMLYPDMEKGEISYISFDEYKQRLLKPQAKKKTDEEVLKDAEDILKSMSRK